MHRTGEVVHGSGLPEVGVHHDAKFLEFIEYSVNRRGTNVRALECHGARYLFGREVGPRADQYLGDGALGHRNPFCGPSDHRDDLIEGVGSGGHATDYACDGAAEPLICRYVQITSDGYR